MTEQNIDLQTTIAALRTELGANRLDNYGSSILVKELLEASKRTYISESLLAIVSELITKNWSTFHDEVTFTFDELHDYLACLARVFTNQYRENLEGYNFGQVVGFAVLRKAVTNASQREISLSKQFGRLFAESVRNQFVGTDEEFFEHVEYLLTLFEEGLVEVPTGVFVDEVYRVVSNQDR